MPPSTPPAVHINHPGKKLRFRGLDRPVYPSVRAASEEHQPAIVVIATPTPSHASACDEAARYFPGARLLVEKPAAATLAGARHVLSGLGRHQPVDVAYHMSFSPEVTWGQEIVRANQPRIGDLISAGLFFTDPYYDDFGHAQAALGNSWLDSGINALSVLSRHHRAPVAAHDGHRARVGLRGTPHVPG